MIAAESARSVRLKPDRTQPGTYVMSFEGSWRDFHVPADKAEFIAEVVQAWLVVQAGVSYTQAQADMREALGLR